MMIKESVGRRDQDKKTLLCSLLSPSALPSSLLEARPGQVGQAKAAGGCCPTQPKTQAALRSLHVIGWSGQRPGTNSGL